MNKTRKVTGTSIAEFVETAMFVSIVAADENERVHNQEVN